MILKKVFALPFLLLALSLSAQQDWIRTGTGLGVEKVRIAVPDLPTPLWDQVTRAVAQWWSAHEEQRFRSAGLPLTAPV